MQGETGETRGPDGQPGEEGWSRADVAWERAQLRGLECFRARDDVGAARAWEEAYRIACRHFEQGDPRRAASNTSHGYVLMHRGETVHAQMLLQDALTIWEESWFWIMYMRPEPDEDGRRAERYGRKARAAFEKLADQGRAVTESVLHTRRLPRRDGLAAWDRERPKAGCDKRKLLAAVLLIVGQPDRRRASSSRAA
jgi:hypothetical protein